jgi:uncharacterized membrane protein
LLVSILLLAVLGLAFYVYLIRADVRYLRGRLEKLEDLDWANRTIAPESTSVPRTARVVVAKPAGPAATTTRSVEPEFVPPPPPPPVAPEPEAAPLSARINFENLVGGKLPIWVGGIALVFAGFFLVRYTIEAGLFGPAARSVTATLFAGLLIAISLFGARLPKIGDSFAADPRVGQSLAGAGIATLYGTLYMAAEIYGLLGVDAAFILVVLTTAIAFALSIRHGPPTALMGLTGGFLAPWVAGMGASNLPTLLLYLAVFIAALFGLAVWRRWLWLLVLASGGGLLWSLFLLLNADSNLGLLAGFVAITGGGAVLASQRFEHAKGIWSELARFAPTGLAFVQLAFLLPKMEFSIIGWMFYFVLSALAIGLAWRDKILVPLVIGALLVAMVPLSTAWSLNGATQSNALATLAVILLFGMAGHVRARSSADASTSWAIIGLSAPVLGWFNAVTSHSIANDNVWAGIALLAAAPAAWTAYEWQAKQRAAELQKWATGAAAVMLWAAIGLLLGEDWFPASAAIIALGIAAWAKVTQGISERRMSLIPLTVAIFTTIAFSYQFLDAVGASLSGAGAVMNRLPGILEAVRTTCVPALLIGAIAWSPLFAAGERTRKVALLAGGAGVTACVWLLAKQVAAITSPSDFIRLGFAERAIITQFFFGLGWFVFAQSDKRPALPHLRSAALVLTGIGIFRVIWFDLIVHNPLFDPQAVGPVPIANLATVHCASVAAWLWILAARLPARVPGKGLSLGMMIVATGVTVRQAFQGNLLSGADISNSENYAYSAAFMLLSVAWLFLGIRRELKLLRFAGLLLLTVVTLKVFLVDAAALTGLLRIFSFLGLGIALIGIGWAYGQVMRMKNPLIAP